MADILDIIDNIQTLYSSADHLSVLKDFERVIDELDIYVFENWSKGELVKGPVVQRHWVSCSFMWMKNEMPDPEGAKRLSDYGCNVRYVRDVLVEPREVKTPDDLRDGTQKGKLDYHDIWVVDIEMPKKLMSDVFGGFEASVQEEIEASRPEVQLEEPIAGTDNDMEIPQ